MENTRIVAGNTDRVFGFQGNGLIKANFQSQQKKRNKLSALLTVHTEGFVG